MSIVFLGGSARGIGENMENGTLMAAPALVGGPSLRLRASSVITALALVFAMFVLVQNRADAAPAATAEITASVASGAAINAQFGGGGLDFRQLFCGILISIRNAFAGSPIFGFVQAILNRLIIGFGCAPS